jgi:hypothetical protein
MLEGKEQGVRIKVCVKPVKNGAKTLEILKTPFGDECMSPARTFESFKRSKDSSA